MEMAFRSALNTRFFVRNLPWSFCEESLKSFFSRYGTVKKATVIFDLNTGLSKQYGFVEMSTAEEVNDILDTKVFYISKGRKIEVEMANDRNRRRIDRSLDYHTKP